MRRPGLLLSTLPPADVGALAPPITPGLKTEGRSLWFGGRTSAGGGWSRVPRAAGEGRAGPGQRAAQSRGWEVGGSWLRAGEESALQTGAAVQLQPSRRVPGVSALNLP